MSEERQDAIDARAARWVSRLSGAPLRPLERRRLRRWLSAHPDHRAAFDYARTTWLDLGSLRDAPHLLLEDPPSKARMSLSGSRRRPFPSAPALALAACLALAVGLGALWFGDPTPLLLADHRTAPAETQRLTLSDGSQLELGPASAVAVRFTAEQRRIELLSGLIYISTAPTAPTEQRPFLVEAAGATTMAVGTEFTVEQLPDSVRVAVVSDSVQLTGTSSTGSAWQAQLPAGQSLRYSPESGAGLVQTVAVETIAPWRRGRLLFDRVPLAEVVAALNRYRREQIVILDPALADREVSGLFETDRLDEALDKIVRELGLRQVTVPLFATLLY